MSAEAAQAFSDLVDLRREQMTAVADALSAAVDLEEVMQTEASGRHLETVEQLLAGAPNEETRGLWASLIERATRSIPATNGDTPS